VALEYVRKHYANFDENAVRWGEKAWKIIKKTKGNWMYFVQVLYFADDDNTYDIRLFEQYIKKVKTIGLWAVGLSLSNLGIVPSSLFLNYSGLAGGAQVEAPRVANGTITGWDVVYAPNRRFAIDMAGFAIK
jgi:hypothetical protein